ncbi:hypothetical protein Y886_42155 [Xanthomonas hyacinthi DSM 19077]|nr:hypothetical protein Y886_42155 [Xanthomonas hyacinthi DSM 19077]
MKKTGLAHEVPVARTYRVMQVGLLFVLRYADALSVKLAKELMCSRAASFGEGFQMWKGRNRIVL